MDLITPPALLKGEPRHHVLIGQEKAFVPGQRSQPSSSYPMAPHPFDQQEESDCQGQTCVRVCPRPIMAKALTTWQLTKHGDPARAEFPKQALRGEEGHQVTFLP